MARKCELTGAGYLRGNLVSHANNKTKRRFNPNVKTLRLESAVLKRRIRCKIAIATLRSVDVSGGLDNFLRKAKPRTLSPAMQRLRKQIIKATG